MKSAGSFMMANAIMKTVSANTANIKTRNMNREYKTFYDLQFKPYADGRPEVYVVCQRTSRQAIMDFSNGYGVSVLCGKDFYSNGINTFEVGIRRGDNLTFDTPITDDVIGWQTPEQITEIMKQVQDL